MKWIFLKCSTLTTCHHAVLTSTKHNSSISTEKKKLWTSKRGQAENPFRTPGLNNSDKIETLFLTDRPDHFLSFLHSFFFKNYWNGLKHGMATSWVSYIICIKQGFIFSLNIVSWACSVMYFACGALSNTINSILRYSIFRKVPL